MRSRVQNLHTMSVAAMQPPETIGSHNSLKSKKSCVSLNSKNYLKPTKASTAKSARRASPSSWNSRRSQRHSDSEIETHHTNLIPDTTMATNRYNERKGGSPLGSWYGIPAGSEVDSLLLNQSPSEAGVEAGKEEDESWRTQLIRKNKQDLPMKQRNNEAQPAVTEQTAFAMAEATVGRDRRVKSIKRESMVETVKAFILPSTTRNVTSDGELSQAESNMLKTLETTSSFQSFPESFASTISATTPKPSVAQGYLRTILDGNFDGSQSTPQNHSDGHTTQASQESFKLGRANPTSHWGPAVRTSLLASLFPHAEPDIPQDTVESLIHRPVSPTGLPLVASGSATSSYGTISPTRCANQVLFGVPPTATIAQIPNQGAGVMSLVFSSRARAGYQIPVSRNPESPPILFSPPGGGYADIEQQRLKNPASAFFDFRRTCMGQGILSMLLILTLGGLGGLAWFVMLNVPSLIGL